MTQIFSNWTISINHLWCFYCLLTCPTWKGTTSSVTHVFFSAIVYLISHHRMNTKEYQIKKNMFSSVHLVSNFKKERKSNRELLHTPNIKICGGGSKIIIYIILLIKLIKGISLCFCSSQWQSLTSAVQGCQRSQRSLNYGNFSFGFKGTFNRRSYGVYLGQFSYAPEGMSTFQSSSGIP